MMVEQEGLETISSFLESHQKLRDEIVGLQRIEEILTNGQLRYLYLVSLFSSDNVYDTQTAVDSMKKLHRLKNSIDYLNLEEGIRNEVKKYVDEGIDIVNNDLKNFKNEIGD